MSSRRLMGPNLFDKREGGVLEIVVSRDEKPALLAAWRRIMTEVLARLHWSGERVVIREHPEGAQLFLSAPVDALLAATEINEATWAAAEWQVEAGQQPETGALVSRLRVHLQHEARPALVALQRAAAEHERSFTFDDDGTSLGSGKGVLLIGSRAALPSPDEIDWTSLADVPVALVTGSNGKTTTCRLLASMLSEAGHHVGMSSTDGVSIGKKLVATGDYSGPAGARLVLRDSSVTAAVLETARGGLLRRGLATSRAEVAVVTRVAPDHFGEYGIHDLSSLAQVKLIVARVILPHGRAVLNADDPTLLEVASTVHAPIVWFSMDHANPALRKHLQQGGEVCVLREGEVLFLGPAGQVSFGAARDMPLTLGGRARYNVENVLAATAGAVALGVSPEAIRQALARFGATPDDNPGRLVLLEREGVSIVVDFVHNPDGWRALYETLEALPASRRIVVLGQAGDREDTALGELAEAVMAGKPALVILKEMEDYLRGRPRGEITTVLANAFASLGMPAGKVLVCDDEIEAVSLALRLAERGDMLVLGVHSDYDGVMRLLQGHGARPLTLPT
ncbi:MAG: Mur ligase family protein [Gemmatimonadaceae bacterium]